MRLIDLTGQKFGRLEVKEFAGTTNNKTFWNCVCDCGNIKRVYSGHLKSGATKSCGCFRNEQVSKAITKHGQRRISLTTLIYFCWRNMMERCYKPKNRAYKNYGGRGIKVCERWHEFVNFYEDMGDAPDGMSLDRKDNDGDYYKENCRWATKEEQSNNTRRNVWYTHEGETKNITQWERHLGMGENTLRMRLNKYGWSEKRALTTPARRRCVKTK
jgi:hypothetical protein